MTERSEVLFWIGIAVAHVALTFFAAWAALKMTGC